MTRIKCLWKLIALAAVAAAALTGASTTRAATVIPADYTLYLSAPGTGTVAGVAYADEDVLRYSPSASPKWAMHFDGSAAGLPAAADIDAYDYAYNANTFTSWHYMSFDQPVAVPGLGTVDDSDVVLYHTGLLGNTWSLFFDGSAYGLTTDGEDIDGLETSEDGTIYLSTAGAFAVPGFNNTVFKGADEDYLMWSPAVSAFVWRQDGNDLGIPSGNDLFNLALASPDGGRAISLTVYLLFSVQQAATIQGLSAGAYDVLLDQYAPYNATGDYLLLWDASASGFPKIDALDVVLDFD